MNARMDVLVVNDGGMDEQIVRELLAPDEDVRLAGYLDHLEGNWPQSDVVVVACGAFGPTASDIVRRSVEADAGRPVVLLTHGAPNGYVDEAFVAGVADIVVVPDHCSVALAGVLSQQVRFSLGKAVARSAGGGRRTQGKMVVMIGPKGGSGKTLTTTNLAAALADAGKKTVIVDLDLQFGDVGLALGLSPEKTVYDLLMSGGSLDDEKLDAFLLTHDSGARALLAPRRPDEAGRITVDFLNEIYPLLRATHDVVIIDTPPAFTPEVIAAVDASSDVCLVGMLDSLSLKNTRLGLETLDLMGYPRANVRFLLNRADSQVGIGLDEVTDIVGGTPDVLVPSDRTITRSVNDGTPIALADRGSDAAKAFHRLAAIIAGTTLTVEGASKRRRRLSFSRSS